VVKLQGALGRVGGSAGRDPIEFRLRDGATAGDLLGQLACRFGEPFAGYEPQSAGRFPAGVRMFVDGQLAIDRAQSLAAPGVEQQKVIVVLTTALMGGA
jgi:hypothetical protein